MPRIQKLAFGLAMLASPAWADISRPPAAAAQTQGWPSWAVVLVTFTLFLGLIVLLSRFVRADRPNNKDDSGGLFGP